MTARLISSLHLAINVHMDIQHNPPLTSHVLMEIDE